MAPPPVVAITLELMEAEYYNGHYFDLFSNTYYFQNNPEKRTLAAKRYALLKTCQELVESKDFTIKEVFEAYKGIESASIKNYYAFLRKLKEFRFKDAKSCIHGSINQKRPTKVNPYVELLIHSYLSLPEKYNYNEVKEFVNQSIVEYNQSKGTNYGTISEGTVGQYFRKNRNEINYKRDRKQFDEDFGFN